MSRELSPAAIVRALAQEVCKRLVRKVVLHLQGMKESLLSGDDSGLQNTWEEICVQIQDEESVCWGAYDHTTRSLVTGFVGELPAHEREAIWLQTGPGQDWRFEDEAEREPYPVDNGDVVDYLVSEWVYAEADRWTNARIRKYLDR
jgi:hypothetical protein